MTLNDAYADAAVDWMVEMASGEMTDRDLRAFERWLEKDPRNEAAWLRLQESLSPLGRAGMDKLPPGALTRKLISVQVSRRRAIRGMLAVAGVGAIGLAAADRFVPLHHLLASHVTRTGERRAVSLNGGAEVLLAPRTAVDLVNGDRQASIRLLDGQLLIDGMSAEVPFGVQVGDVMLRSTRGHFAVSTRGGVTSFTGLKGGATLDAGRSYELSAGQRATFAGDQPAVFQTADAQVAAAWADGLLIAQNMSLAEIVEELRPYWSGIIRLSPKVATLQASGVLQLSEPVASLETLAASLELQVRQLSPYWIRIEPASTRAA